MPEDPKPKSSPDSPEEMNRRQFFVKLGVGSVAVAALGTAAFSYEYLSPNVLYEPSPVVESLPPLPERLGDGPADAPLSASPTAPPGPRAAPAFCASYPAPASPTP